MAQRAPDVDGTPGGRGDSCASVTKEDALSWKDRPVATGRSQAFSGMPSYMPESHLPGADTPRTNLREDTGPEWHHLRCISAPAPCAPTLRLGLSSSPLPFSAPLHTSPPKGAPTEHPPGDHPRESAAQTPGAFLLLPAHPPSGSLSSCPHCEPDQRRHAARSGPAPAPASCWPPRVPSPLPFRAETPLP